MIYIKNDPTNNNIIDTSRIRLFTPREIANLHCFPSDFGKYVREIINEKE